MTLTIYPYQVNSPEFTLADPVSAYDVSFNWIDASEMLPAPNLITLGTGEDAETCLYTTLVGNVMGGITRGFDVSGNFGVAKAWGAGEVGARRWTAYDARALEDNVTSGGVTGDTGSTDNAIIRADGTGGSTVQAGPLVCDDSGNVTGFHKIQITKGLTTDHTCSGVSAILTAHENFTLFQIGYINASGEVALSDADSSANMPVRAMATAAISADATGVFLLSGFARDDTWNWTPGGALYADTATAGGMTQTAPSGSGDVVQIVGYAITADIIQFTPDITFIELT